MIFTLRAVTGLSAAIKATIPSAKHIPDIDHMIKNFGKSKIKNVNGEEVRVPRMRSKRERYLASLLHIVALLPSTSLFLVCLQTLLQRMKQGWNEAEFHDYFVKEYLYPVQVRPAVYGIEQAHAARWWYGLSSAVAAGHCPTWQTTEQSHRQFKRALTDSAERTVLTVLETVKETVELWSSQRTTEEDSYALFCPPGFMASRPIRPDTWMVSGKLLHTVRLPGQGVTMLPTIKRLLEAET